MTLQDWIAIITLVVLTITAGAAIWLGWLTRTDIREAREARYDQSRPILMFEGTGPDLEVKQTLGNMFHFYPDLGPEHITVALRNIGSGPALDIRGVIFCPVPGGPSEDQTPHSFRVPVPIPQNGPYNAGTKQGAFGIQGATTIGRDRRYTLYAPPRPLPGDFAAGVTTYAVARLTITYHDIFGRKHASIFDYTTEKEWRTVDEGFFSDIKQDIEDLVREHAASLRPQMEPLTQVPPQLRA